MNRKFALAGAAFVGLVASLALAAPASAHHSVVTGKGVCDTATGEYVVTWTVDSEAPEEADKFRLTEVDAAYTAGDKLHPGKVDGIAVTAEGYPHDATKSLTGTQRVPGDSGGAVLAVRAAWNNDVEEEEPAHGKVELAADCKADELVPAPDASAKSTCENLVVTVLNDASGETAAQFVVTAGPAFGTTVTVAVGAQATVNVPKAAAIQYGVSVVEQILFFTKDFVYDDTGLDCEELPTTGAPAGALAGGAGALLAVGAGLLVVARRRRLRFSA